MFICQLLSRKDEIKEKEAGNDCKTKNSLEMVVWRFEQDIMSSIPAAGNVKLTIEEVYNRRQILVSSNQTTLFVDNRHFKAMLWKFK